MSSPVQEEKARKKSYFNKHSRLYNQYLLLYGEVESLEKIKNALMDIELKLLNKTVNNLYRNIFRQIELNDVNDQDYDQDTLTLTSKM